MVLIIFLETIGKIENLSPNKIKHFSTCKKDFIVPDSGTGAQEDCPNVQNPESGNLNKKASSEINFK
jgi:hypothetical protein